MSSVEFHLIPRAVDISRRAGLGFQLDPMLLPPGYARTLAPIQSAHIENWTDLHILTEMHMDLYTGLERLTIMNSNLDEIHHNAFAKNPHLRYM
ncbi:hypothetical protein AAFF_G00105260 [Aldrovandia affinis]|uniref:Uncharacterized protein n=1 Tax=Aldrovandia affinis TaxID=143900 RepID=A0AAD7T1Z4_9TELE|nr:hypothetical protein AAFF_G00105260 [Aldrovandia affinis]